MSELVYHVAQLVQTIDREEKLSKSKKLKVVFHKQCYASVVTVFTGLITYTSSVFYISDSIYFAVFSVCNLVSNVVLVLARLASIIVSVLTLWYGLALENKEQIDLEQGNFNTAPVRLALLGGVCALQAYVYNT